MLTKEKIDALHEAIAQYKTAVISLSGGMDSIAMAAASKEVLGAENVKTVTAITAFLTETEKNTAKQVSERLGIEHSFVRVFLMKSPDVVRNDSKRCYYCKQIILDGIESVRKNLGFDVIFDGGNISDNCEYRPGAKAVEEYGVISPFKIAGFTKDDIAELMKSYGLSEYIVPSNSCLATRIKTGQQIDFYHIRLVCAAETYLASKGFTHIRCRVDGDNAKIQVEKDEVPELLAHADEIIYEIKMIGFKEVTIDENGYTRSECLT